jgi:ferredoxin-NADP reductase/ferredoxin
MTNVTFKSSNKSISAEPGEWLYEVCERAQSGVPFACKAGACGTCATELLEGADALGPPSARELRTLETAGLDGARFRLPCLYDVPATGDLTFGAPAHAAGRALATHDVVVESWRPLNHTVCEVRFFVESGPFEFKPGQYLIFHVPNRQEGKVIRRSYSISTPPSERGHFEVCVRAVSGGHGSNYVHRLRPGRKLKVEGPFGDFVLDENSKKDILLIATGTGMSPIRSMLTHLLYQRSDRRIRLFFGLRHEGDLFYTDLLRGLAAHYPGFEYHITLSQPSAWGGHRGRVTDLLGKMISAKDAANTEVYMCGSHAMIRSCAEQLRALGFPEDAVKHEQFY